MGTASLDTQEHATNAASKPAEWWRRLTRRCAADNCSQGNTKWYPVLQRSVGIEFQGRWYCHVNCVTSLFTRSLRQTLATFGKETPKSYRLPLGLLLAKRGAISPAQLRAALELQKHRASSANTARIGKILLEMQAIKPAQLTAALAHQWGCPIFPFNRQLALGTGLQRLPLALLESIQAIPVNASADGATVHIAFAERVDHSALYAIEHSLGCRAMACIAPESEVVWLLRHFRRTITTEETIFETVRQASEIAATVSSYAEELKATKFTCARLGSFIWVRFNCKDVDRDVLFRILSAPGVQPAQMDEDPQSNALSFSADLGVGGFAVATTVQ